MTALVGALCFLVGVLVGVVSRDALALYRQSRKERPMRTPRISYRAFLSILLAVAVIANLSCAVLLIVARADNQAGDRSAARLQADLVAYVNCQADYQQQTAIALQARIAANAPVEAAVEATFRGVAASDVDAMRAGVNAYLEAVDKRTAERTRHPLPSFPDVICGLPPTED